MDYGKITVTGADGQTWEPVSREFLLDKIRMAMRLVRPGLKKRYAVAADPSRLEAERLIAEEICKRLDGFAVLREPIDPMYTQGFGASEQVRRAIAEQKDRARSGNTESYRAFAAGAAAACARRATLRAFAASTRAGSV